MDIDHPLVISALKANSFRVWVDGCFEPGSRKMPFTSTRRAFTTTACGIHCVLTGTGVLGRSESTASLRNGCTASNGHTRPPPKDAADLRHRQGLLDIGDESRVLHRIASGNVSGSDPSQNPADGVRE